MKSTFLPICFIFHLLIWPINKTFAQDLSVGLYHNQYICKDGRAMSWGKDCGEGRTGRWGNKHYPGYVNLPFGIKKVSAGGYHSLYLDSMGYVWSSGKNDFGQTGTGFQGATTHMIIGIDSIIDISAGISHSLFLRYDGTVYACGRNHARQLGDGTNILRSTPVLIPGLDSVVQLSAGIDFSLFVRSDGSVYGSGSNGCGKLGLGPYNYNFNSPPVKIDSLTNIKSASAGEYNSLFLDYNGRAYFCGDNGSNQAGLNSQENHIYYPLQINGVDSITQVAVLTEWSVFLRSDSTVWICGRNVGAFVSGGTNFDGSTVVEQIQTLSGVTEIAVGSGHLVFEIGDSILFSMGDNHDGILGDGSTMASYIPVLVTNLCGAPLVFPPNTANLNENAIDQIEIYPNPAIHQFEVDVPEHLIQENYQLLNIHGQIVLSGKANSAHIIFNVSKMERGMYFLKFKNTVAQKIVLN